MSDFLDTLAMHATKTIESGYYQKPSMRNPKISFKKAILTAKPTQS